LSSKRQERSAIVHGSLGIGKAGIDAKALLPRPWLEFRRGKTLESAIKIF